MYFLFLPEDSEWVNVTPNTWEASAKVAALLYSSSFPKTVMVKLSSCGLSDDLLINLGYTTSLRGREPKLSLDQERDQFSFSTTKPNL